MAREMTWEEKLDAMIALAPGTTIQRRPGANWYVAMRGCEITKDDSGILDGRYGNGATPQLAVEDAWKTYTELKPEEYIIRGAMSNNPRHFRWNGYMWEELHE